MDNSYLFIFGNTPELSFAEFQSIYAGQQYVRKTPHCVSLNSHDISPHDALMRLGGTVKIANALTSRSDITIDEIVALVVQEADAVKAIFGFSIYGTDAIDIQQLSVQVKKKLAEKDVSARFVLPKKGDVLSSVVVWKQRVQEYVIVYDGTSFLIGRTCAVQDFEDWGKRDIERPRRDMDIGMLPPKVARMAINIGVGADASRKTILDPFCGVGTILTEAALLGCTVYGSDISEKALQYAKENVAWLEAVYGISVHHTLLMSDATHISAQCTPDSIDAVITEPFLGPTNLGHGQAYSTDKLKNIIKGLEKMYMGALKDWLHILKPDGCVVMALPEITQKHQTFFVKRVIDRCEKLGYTTEQGPIEYSRKGAVVRRKFYIFKKIHNN